MRRIPPSLRSRFSDWSWTLWWYYPGAQTWKLERRGEVLFLKVAEEDRYLSLAGEAERLRWAAEYIAVPKVFYFGGADGIQWMLTEILAGKPATDQELKADPASLVPLLAKGLLRFHKLPVAECPFDFRAELNRACSPPG